MVMQNLDPGILSIMIVLGAESKALATQVHLTMEMLLQSLTMRMMYG